MFEAGVRDLEGGGPLWSVSALLRAMDDSLQARFNPVSVQGEISGLTRASSGHCYFVLKDEQGQIRCALFRRAASMLDFAARDGQRVQVRGRLSVYGPRGELQLVVESLRRLGQGQLLEQFLELKAKLQAEGLFDADRKRELPFMPRALGVVTSLGAAALHDVLTALRRRAPHLPVVVYPASVQGAQAPAQLRAALQLAYDRAEVDVLLLVRGGGALEDLWSFNDEALARLIVQSPMPVVSGVGHETDFTIADFCADVRAATPTAAAELAARPQAAWLEGLQLLQERLLRAQQGRLDQLDQALDRLAARLGQPSHGVARAQARLNLLEQRLGHAAKIWLQREHHGLERWSRQLPQQVALAFGRQQSQVEHLSTRLGLLDPRLVLQRGYAWLSDEQGRAVTHVAQVQPGQGLKASLADGELALQVLSNQPQAPA
ncbi:MAG: exodeoxyribonuclease VII large subunit [Betaproteobacteria bacterium]